METVAHTAPVTSLETLDVESPAEDKETQYYYTDKAEVHSPQYVAFDVQCPLLPAVAKAGLILVVSCSFYPSTLASPAHAGEAIQAFLVLPG